MGIHPPGTRLGPFEVIAAPFNNDLSIDYLCLDRQRSCPALLKALRPELLSNQTAPDSFARGGAAWVALGAHPHIVRCHNVLEFGDSGEIYLVLQVVVPKKEHETPSLLSWFSPGQPLPVLQALLFAIQIARGMHYLAAHMPETFHADLKPENILVSEGRLLQADVNRLRLTEIGLSAVLNADDPGLPNSFKTGETAVAQTQLVNGVVGTPLYMPPEQWQGESAGAATDIYALGCILYRMLVGRHPVAGKTVPALRNDHITGNLRPLPASLPGAVLDLAARCLALKPGERYQSWAEVEIAIAEAYESAVKFPPPAAEPADACSESERVWEGWFLDSMGFISYEAGNTDTAVECLELAQKVGHTLNDQKLVCTATANLGNAYLALGDPQRAIDNHTAALVIAEQIADRFAQALALNGLGTDHLQLSDPRQAIQYFEKALTLAREIHNKQNEMSILCNLGSAYDQLGDPHRSIQYYEQTQEIACKIGDRRGESTALTNLGAAYTILGDHRRAIRCLEQALAITSEMGNRQGQATILVNLGNGYRDLGNAQRAFEYYNHALRASREMGNRRGEAAALNNIGSTFANVGELSRALIYHERALQIFREIGDKRNQGDCLTNLSFIYKCRHDTQQAVEYCTQALAIDREVGDRLGLALDSFNMANLLAQQNRFREALACAEESAGTLEELGFTDKASQARQLVDALRAQLGQHTSGAAQTTPAASHTLRQQIMQVRQDNPGLTAKMSDEDIIELFQQADQAIANDRPTTFIAHSPTDAQRAQEAADNQTFDSQSMAELLACGQQLFYNGDWEKADRAFSALLKKADKANNILYQSQSLLFQGRLYGGRGDQTHALSLFRQALNLSKYIDNLALICQIYASMGVAFEYQGSYKEAIEHYNFAIEICRHTGDVSTAAISWTNLGNVYRNQGNFDQAARIYQASLDSAIRIGAEQITGWVYCNLGIMYYLQGLHDLAIETSQKSLEIASRFEDQVTILTACSNLGTLLAEQGDYSTAIEMTRKALKIVEQRGAEPFIAQKYADLASLYTKMGNTILAFLNYDRALIFYKRISDNSNMAKIHFNMGNLYQQQGKTAQARQQFQQAQAIFESIGELENAEQAAQQLRY